MIKTRGRQEVPWWGNLHYKKILFPLNGHSWIGQVVLKDVWCSVMNVSKYEKFWSLAILCAIGLNYINIFDLELCCLWGQTKTLNFLLNSATCWSAKCVLNAELLTCWIFRNMSEFSYHNIYFQWLCWFYRKIILLLS